MANAIGPIMPMAINKPLLLFGAEGITPFVSLRLVYMRYP